MLADAEVHVAAAGRAGFQIAGAFECEMRLGGRREIGRAADQPRMMRGNGVEHLAGGVARGKALRVGGENRKSRVPAIGKLAPLHALDLVGKIGVLCSVGCEQRAPIFLETSAAPADAVLKMLAHAVRHQEFGVLGPAIASLGETDFLLAERLAVGGAGVVLVRGAVADMTFDDDQGRHIVGSLEDLDRLRQPLSYRWRRRRAARSSHRRGSAPRHRR